MAVRASPESGGGTAGRAFEPPFGCLTVLLWSSKMAQKDGLEEENKRVESSQIVGMAVAEKTTGAWHASAGLHARPVALGACRRVGARGRSEKFEKNVRKSRKIFY